MGADGLRVLYPDADGRSASLVAADPEQARQLAERLHGRVVAADAAPAPTPVKQYVLERQFGIRRRNGGFV